jgi:hypothetical protein
VNSWCAAAVIACLVRRAFSSRSGEEYRRALPPSVTLLAFQIVDRP